MNNEIIEYEVRYSDKRPFKCYRGPSKCVRCYNTFYIETDDKTIFNNTKCFKCFMEPK